VKKSMVYMTTMGTRNSAKCGYEWGEGPLGVSSYQHYEGGDGD
jgi:hypothetical protein